MADIPLERAVVCFVPGNAPATSKQRGAVIVCDSGSFEVEILPNDYVRVGAVARTWRQMCAADRLAAMNTLFVKLVVQHACPAPAVTRALSFVPEWREQWELPAP